MVSRIEEALKEISQRRILISEKSCCEVLREMSFQKYLRGEVNMSARSSFRALEK